MKIQILKRGSKKTIKKFVTPLGPDANLAIKLRNESKLVAVESMKILKEFEFHKRLNPSTE